MMQCMAFPWTEVRQRIAELARLGSLSVAQDHKSFAATGPDGAPVAQLFPPPCLPIGALSPAAYVSALPATLGTLLVFLVRAGACACGVWKDDELILHKVIKKYVVRGNGRAQTSYRKTKGKSRAGSRLRLRNAQSLLEETNARLIAWQRQVGRFDRVFFYAPERLRSDLFGADPAPPFTSDDPRVALIPTHVHEPGFEELLRVHRFLTHGRVVLPA